MNVACYVTAVARDRQPILARQDVATIILQEVDFYRGKHGYRFCGHVIMPDHWHFVMIADEERISAILRDLKSMIGRLVIDAWKASPLSHPRLARIALPEPRKRGHEYSLWQEGNWKVLLEEPRQIERRLDYMHANPVRARLVPRAEDWPWSSYRWYASREPVGIAIDMDWL